MVPCNIGVYNDDDDGDDSFINTQLSDHQKLEKFDGVLEKYS